ncbi:hypothetical protein WCZ60_004800 [Escherichia coli]
MMGIESAQDALFSMMFKVIPWMFGILIVFGLLGKVVGPIMDDIITARQKDREERRERENKAKQRGTLAATEIAIRGEFDDWLEAEALRLQIECAAQPDDQGRADALAAVEAAKTENAARIVALHQQDDATPIKSNGPEAVKQQWEALRAKGASPQTAAA